MSYVTTALALIGQDALSTVVVAVLALGPGWMLAYGLATRLGWTLTVVIPMALAVTTALVGISASAATALSMVVGLS